MAQIIPSSVPYALNRISMKIGAIVLSHADQIQEKIAETKKRRNEMYAKVKELRSIQFYPSQANFLHGCCDHKEELLALFAKENIVIRNYQGKNTFRITIGNAEENEKVWQVLKQYEEEFA
jgi:histidinol-phosphate aminotransferase